MKRVRRWLSAGPAEFKRWDQAAELAGCPTWQRWAKLVLMQAATATLEREQAAKPKRKKSR